MRNIEIKARYADFAFARKCVEEEDGKHHETIRQTDVYFRIASGRMKLRYIDAGTGYLVYYRRDNNPEPRESEYHIYHTESPVELELVLATAHGVLAKVRKKREIYLIDNVRVHLDEVQHLGEFIEFEAVLTAGKRPDEEKSKLEKYIDQFRIDRKNLLSQSYLDMVLSKEN